MVPSGEPHLLEVELFDAGLVRVMVAHLTPTPSRLMASAASIVTWSSVSSRCSMPVVVVKFTSRCGKISCSLIIFR
jgi:hypothetical protein